MRKFLILLATLAAAPALWADVPTQGFLPESGFYWNPEQPGRGYAIEIQDRTLFMTIYVYTDEATPAQREPLWYSASATLARNTGGSLTYRFQSNLAFSEDGQCLGCDFVAPLTTITGLPIEITFDSPIHGVMTIDGEDIELFRFWYSQSITDPILAMFGQWMVVTDYTDVDNTILPFDGDLLEIGFLSTSDGETVASGVRGGTDRNVVGAYDLETDFFVIVVGESNQAFLAYYFTGDQFGTDRFNGLAERFVPGGNLTGLGFPAYGQRISDRTFAEGRFGTKRAAAPVDGPAVERPMSRKSGEPVPGIDVERLNRMVRGLEAQLREQPLNDER